jgi:hypothetical protein
MAGFTDAYENTVLDLAIHSTTDVVKFATSSVGANATTGVAMAFAAAASGAKSNSAIGETGTITAGGAFTHFALFATGGSTQKTDWTALTGGTINVSANGKITWQIGDFTVTLD